MRNFAERVLPWRVPAAEDALVGATPGEPAFREAGRALVAGARGWGDNDFKIGLAQRTRLRVVLAQLGEEAGAIGAALLGALPRV